MPVSRPASRVIPRSVPSRAAAPTGLRILVAGVDRDGRAPVEAAVKRAFAGREAEPWSVSLVRLGTLWSVTLNGPSESFRNVSFTAEERRLSEAVVEALRDRSERETGPAPSASAASARSTVQERHACGKCGLGILICYESEPGEAKHAAPVACPHCWAVGQVEIGAWAASGGDYRAEKA